MECLGTYRFTLKFPFSYYILSKKPQKVVDKIHKMWYNAKKHTKSGLPAAEAGARFTDSVNFSDGTYFADGASFVAGTYVADGVLWYGRGFCR